MKKILGIIAGTGLIAGAIILYRSFSQEPLFYRESATALPQDAIRFRCDDIQGRIFYKSKNSEEWLDKLPNHQGGFFYLRRIKHISFTPRYAQTNGLYSFVYFRSRGKNQSIAFTLYRKRAHNYLKILLNVSRRSGIPSDRRTAFAQRRRISLRIFRAGNRLFQSPDFLSSDGTLQA